MYKYILKQCLAGMLIFSGLNFTPAWSQGNSVRTIQNFDNNFKINTLTLINGTAKVIAENKNRRLWVKLGHAEDKPSINFGLPSTDYSGYIGIAMDITNLGSTSIAIEAQCYNEDFKKLSIADGAKFYYRSMVVLEPGETDSLLITLSRASASLPDYIQARLPGMFGIPGGYVRRKENLDLSKITNISIFKQRTRGDYTFTVDNIRAVGKYMLPTEHELKTSFFPFVDEFGQFKHGSWPGKITIIDEIKAQHVAEEKELAVNDGPATWNQYGGWEKGPSLSATGHFRVQKYNGKWWFVDPEGKLFWSQGINIIGFSQRTPSADREHFFTKLPVNNDFYRNNLSVKYGAYWTGSSRKLAAEFFHRRLRSWGVNTIAANSDPYLYQQKKTPYTIEIRSGIPNPLPAQIDEESFRKRLIEALQRPDIVQAVNDPWCLGYFMDNELGWPSENANEVINMYFRIVKEELKKLAPNKLYLGARINSPNFNRFAFEASARYCDVISINHYDYNVSDFKETQGLDKPVIIGEFHYGALDRGLPHPGLRSASNQKQRARIYQHLIDDALENPLFVGAHWFQFMDQVVSGRNDGENYQIGFVDILDKPYPEMISSARNIGSYLYNYRLHGKRSYGK